MPDYRYKDKSPILVVGGGGREHAIIKKLSESPRAGKLYAAPGNAGIAELAECLPIKATQIGELAAAAKEIGAGLVFVAPDDPLMLGLVDLLEENGIPAFGPKKCAAIIEGSKVFAKDLMLRYGIPTAAYRTFSDPKDVLAYVREKNEYPTVIKADGLALGKGAIIVSDYLEAEAAVKTIMEDKVFGESGNHVVVEEFLTGPEVTVLSFTDGKTVRTMVSSQDHKRVFDHDKGPNTGGMGAFAPSPIYTPDLAKRCEKEIFLPTVDAMNREGRTFKGVLYFQLMITKDGPKVIEYNARFGDPETQVVLPLLETDLLDVIDAVNGERLDSLDIVWKKEAAACVVLASGGYPVKYETGFEIRGLDALRAQKDITVYHAGTKKADGRFVTGGGRVLGVTAVAPTLQDAIGRAYEAVKEISFTGMHYRHDIGRKDQ